MSQVHDAGYRLSDGGALEVRLAGVRDTPAIAAEHPLPRFQTLPERPLRTYYEVKAAAYVRAHGSGIALGLVERKIAGFVFFVRDPQAIGRELKSLRALGWVAGRLLTGRLGGPCLWFAFAHWTRQHFAPSGQELSRGLASSDAGQIGTVHTVEAFRRLGVASALLDAAEAELLRLGAPRATLYAATDNVAATALYEKHGYRKQAQVPRDGESCWFMAKDLE